MAGRSDTINRLLFVLQVPMLSWSGGPERLGKGISVMFKILHRYILLDLVKIFVLSTSALTVFLSLAYALGKLRDTGLGPLESAQLIGYFIPAMLVFAMPIAALLTTTLVYGRLAGNNELIACRSSGISMNTLLYPVLLLGLFVGGINYVLFDQVIPWARFRAENVGMQNMERIFFHNMRTKRKFGRDRDSFVIQAQGVSGNTLYGIAATYAPDGQQSSSRFSVFAPVATIHFQKPGEIDPTQSGPTMGQRADGSDQQSQRLTREDVARQPDVWDAEVVHLGGVWLRMIGMHASDSRKENEMAGSQTIHQVLNTTRVLDTNEMTFDQLSRLYRNPRDSFDYRYSVARKSGPAPLEELRQKIKAKALAQMHSRWATIASCVLLVGLGAALGIHFRHGHMLTAFFISMGPAMFAIFSILLGVQLVEGSPEKMHGMVLVIWSGSIMVLLLDAILIGRLVRQ